MKDKESRLLSAISFVSGAVLETDEFNPRDYYSEKSYEYSLHGVLDGLHL